MRMRYKNLCLKNLTGEVWKDVVGYEGLYRVSSFGRVKSISKTKIKDYRCYNKIVICKKRPQILKQYHKKEINSLVVNLPCGKNKYKLALVHRLVCMAFILNPENKKTVNHKDGNRINNDLKNLEWATQLENNLHSLRVLRNTIKPVFQYSQKMNFIKKWCSVSEIIKKHKFDIRDLRGACRGEVSTRNRKFKNHKYKNYFWFYNKQL